ncbi:hypothetical protein [Desulfovibrio sp. TomC]|uniref:hypothetical protein n=1 Tax=Desulfovibrio sp. TomC TaxID=1562888 RepID=UPI0005753E70|nr:hypothetical protein [Desulfovibrio sp. TomC]KHK01332.1 hypothetical protein NY78_3314 [Desulfovibrio sp. TomC]
MSDAQKTTRKAPTANSGKQPSTPHGEPDVLLPLLGAPAKSVDDDGTGKPLSSLPCDENGNVLLPLLGDAEETLAPGS